MPKVFNLTAVESHFKQVLRYAPGMLGNEAVNFFTDSFRSQGWLGNRFEPWKRRRTDGKRKGRSILVDTGRLRRSIRITSNSSGIVKIGTDVPYAKAHNEGFRGQVTVKAHQRNKYKKNRVGSGKFTKKGKERMKTVSTISGNYEVQSYTRRVNLPERRFMGENPYLTQKLKRILQAEFNKGLR